MPRIVVCTTFRDFVGNENDKMQLNFLKSLKRQTMMDFILVVTVFGEVNVEKTVQSVLGDRCFFIHEKPKKNYKFSLSVAFKNGVDYGIHSGAETILDCSADVILQKNFLETVVKYSGTYTAGISHPNVMMVKLKNGKLQRKYSRISKGIDARYFSLDIFKNKEVYTLLERYPSYDYGCGIEIILCGIAIKYADKKKNIFMESKVLKMENDRDGKTAKVSPFMRKGRARNLPVVQQFLRSQDLSPKYVNLEEINKHFAIPEHKWKYRMMFLREYLKIKK